jgi:hypothetical protein
LLKGAGPNKYRDNVRQEVTGADGAPLIPQKVVIELLPTPRRLPSKALGTRRIPDINPEELAKALTTLAGSGFTPDELLSNAHALLALADDSPRHERLYLAVLHAQETQENGDRRAVIRHEREFTVELLILMQ